MNWYFHSQWVPAPDTFHKQFGQEPKETTSGSKCTVRSAVLTESPPITKSQGTQCQSL